MYSIKQNIQQTNYMAFSPQVSYTDWVTAVAVKFIANFCG
jgi:hypothetical protein